MKMWNFFLSPSKLVLVACPTFCICQLHDKYQNYKYEKQEIFWSGLPSTSKLRVFSQLHPEATWPLSSLQNQLILPEKDCPMFGMIYKRFKWQSPENNFRKSTQMWISDWSLEELAQTGVIILVLVVSLIQVPPSWQEIKIGSKVCLKIKKFI